MCQVCGYRGEANPCPNETCMRGLIETKGGKDRMDRALDPIGPYVDLRIMAHYRSWRGINK